MDGFINRLPIIEIFIDISIATISIVISVYQNEPDAEDQFDREQK